MHPFHPYNYIQEWSLAPLKHLVRGLKGCQWKSSYLAYLANAPGLNITENHFLKHTTAREIKSKILNLNPWNYLSISKIRFNGYTVEVWVINNFTSQCIIDVIAYPC